MISTANDCLADLDMLVYHKLSNVVHLRLGIKQQQQRKLSFEQSQAWSMH